MGCSLFTTTSAIELRQLQHRQDSSRVLGDQTRRRRAARAERELRKLERGGNMKFSHSIQFNAVPDWSSHYISYSNLKKLFVDPPSDSAL